VHYFINHSFKNDIHIIFINLEPFYKKGNSSDFILLTLKEHKNERSLKSNENSYGPNSIHLMCSLIYG
jgi:hypothetical protein